MEFKTLSRLWILVSCYLAFCSATKLPNADRLVVGRCLQSIIYPFFAGEIRENLSVAEFLGITLNCSKNCVKTLVDKIHSELVKEWSTLKETQGVDVEYLLPDIKKFGNAISAAQPYTIQDITDEVQPWLQKYDDAYHTIAKHFLTVNTSYMDKELSHIYFNYESCVQWECAMKSKNDIPLSELMESDKYEKIKHSIFRALGNGPPYNPPSIDSVQEEAEDTSSASVQMG